MTVLAVSATYSIWVDLEIFVGIIFLILIGFLLRTAWKPLSKALRDRQAGIEKQLAAVQDAQREIRELEIKQQELHRKARAQALEMVEEAKRDAAHLREEMSARADQEIAKLKTRAKREIELARRKALHDLADRAAALSLQVAERRLTSELSTDVHHQLVETALAEMRAPAGRSS